MTYQDLMGQNGVTVVGVQPQSDNPQPGAVVDFKNAKGKSFRTFIQPDGKLSDPVAVSGPMNTGWGSQGAEGHHVMYSPPGTAAPRDLVNMDMDSGDVYDRGHLAPPEGKTLSLAPAGYRPGGGGVGRGDDGPVGYGQEAPQSAEDLLADVPDATSTPAVSADAPPASGTGGAEVQPDAPPGYPANWLPSPKQTLGAHTVQYALDENNDMKSVVQNGRKVFMFVDEKAFGPEDASQADAVKAAYAPKPAAAPKPPVGYEKDKSGIWTNKGTGLPLDEAMQKQLNANEKKQAPAGGQDYGQSKSGDAKGNLERYGAAVSKITGNPEAGRFAMAQAMKEGTAGGAWPMGQGGPNSASFNYGGWGGVGDGSPGHPSYATPEEGAQGWVNWLKNPYYKPLADVIGKNGSAEDMANAMATTSAGMWSESHDAQGHNPGYARGIMENLGKFAQSATGDWTVTGSMGGSGVPPGGGGGAGAQGANSPGAYPVSYTDPDTGQTSTHWVTPDRIHYGTDAKGQFAYDPTTGTKKYIPDTGPGLGENVLSAGDGSLVQLSGTPGNVTGKSIYSPKPTQSHYDFQGQDYSYNPKAGTRTPMGAQGPYDVGGELFVPQEMAGQVFGTSAADLAAGSKKIGTQIAGWGTPGSGVGAGDDNPFYGFGDDPNSDPAAMDPSDFAGLGQGAPAGGPPAPPVPPQAVEGMGTKPGEVGLLGQPHQGIDVQAQKGTPVMAPEDGVIHIEHHATGGLVVFVVGKTGTKYKMAHLDAAGVKEGQQVKKGQPIAQVGESGSAATGPNLHFEMQNPDGSQRNPAEALGGMAKMPMSPNTVGQGADTGFGLARVPQATQPQPYGAVQAPQRMQMSGQPRVGWGGDVGVGAIGGDYGQTPSASALQDFSNQSGLAQQAGQNYVPANTSTPIDNWTAPASSGAKPLGYSLSSGVGNSGNMVGGMSAYQQALANYNNQSLQNTVASEQARLAFDQANALGFIGGQPTTNEQTISGNLPNGAGPTLQKQQAYGGTSANPTLQAMEDQGFVFGKPTTTEQGFYQAQLNSALNNPWVQNLTGMAPGVGLPGGAAAFGGSQFGPNPIVKQVGGGDDRVGWGDATSQQLAQNAATPLTGGTLPTTNPATPAASGGSSSGFGVQAQGSGAGGQAPATGSLGFEQPLSAAFSGAATVAPQQSTGFGVGNSGSLTGVSTPTTQGNGVPFQLSATGDPLAAIAGTADVAATPDTPGGPMGPMPILQTVWGPYDPGQPEGSKNNNAALRRLVLNQFINGGGSRVNNMMADGRNSDSVSDEEIAGLVSAYLNSQRAQGPSTPGAAAVAGTPGTPGASGAVDWKTWQNESPFQQAAWLAKNMAAGYSQPQVLAGQQAAFAGQGVTQAPDVTQMTYGTLTPEQQMSYGNTAAIYGMTPQQWLNREQRNWGAGQAAPVSGGVGWA